MKAVFLAPYGRPAAPEDPVAILSGEDERTAAAIVIGSQVMQADGTPVAGEDASREFASLAQLAKAEFHMSSLNRITARIQHLMQHTGALPGRVSSNPAEGENRFIIPPHIRIRERVPGVGIIIRYLDGRTGTQ